MKRTQPDAKTRQHYFFTARQNVLQKLRKLALRKHMIDFEPPALNQIKQYIILEL